MRIIEVIPELGTGGAEVMCEQLTYELKRKGHQVLMVSLYSKESFITARLRNAGIKVVFLNKNNGFDFKCIKKLREVIEDFNADVIHTHLYSLKYAVLANIGYKKKIIHTIHNIASKEQSKLDQKFSRFVFKKHLAVPVSISKKIQDSVVKLYGIKNNDTPVIYNGIDANNIFPKIDYFLHTPIRIIHVARFQEQKNHECLVQSAFDLTNENCIFICLGDGPRKNEIVQMAKTLGVDEKFDFVGAVDNVAPYLLTSDIFVLPSKWEGLPISVLEAMTAGLPIIASDVGGVSDIIEHEVNGILIRPNHIELTRAIQNMIYDRVDRELMGKQALIDSKAYSIERMAALYERVYTQ